MTTIAPGTAPGTLGLSLLPEVTLRVTEDLDISTLHALREQIGDALTLRPQRLIIDLHGCRYLDAQAITVLLDAHREMWRLEGRLVLRGCSPETLRLLAIAGVLSVFETEPRVVPTEPGETP